MMWWRRVVNGLRPDHNPLRRPVDRLESMLTLGLIALFLVATPLIALGVGRWAWNDAAATARTEQAAWHKVSAVVLQGVPAPKNDPYGAIYLAQIPDRAAAGTFPADSPGRVRGADVGARLLAVARRYRAGHPPDAATAEDGRLGRRMAGHRAVVEQLPVISSPGRPDGRQEKP
jgi:hypothetical protein